MKYSREQVRRAAIVLSELVRQQANQMRQLTGIDIVSTADAPSTFNELMLAYHRAKLNTGYLPVSNLHCDNTIYTTPGCNVMFRYWHNMLHCMRGCDFSLAGELAVGAAHCAVVANYLGADSLEHKLMMADTIGQSMHEKITGSFPADQWEFCFNFVNQ